MTRIEKDAFQLGREERLRDWDSGDANPYDAIKEPRLHDAWFAGWIDGDQVADDVEA